MPPSPSPSNKLSPSPSASQSPPTFHPWSRLPDELKLQVLSHLLVYDRTISIYKRSNPAYPPKNSVYLHFYQPISHLFPFIQTRNYKLATLAQEVYYTQNTFHIKLAPNRAHICPWPRASCTAARLMRKVHVSTTLDVNCTLDELLDEEDAGRWLFRRRRSVDDIAVGTIGDEGPSAASKVGFERLDVLDVRIVLRDEEEDEYVPFVLSSDRVQALTELLRKVEFVLGAKKVSVSARVLALDGEIVYDEICGSLGGEGDEEL